MSGPSTTQPAYTVPSQKSTESLLLDSEDVQKNWNGGQNSPAGGTIAAGASPIPPATSSGASAQRVFYATGSTTPVWSK